MAETHPSTPAASKSDTAAESIQRGPLNLLPAEQQWDRKSLPLKIEKLESKRAELRMKLNLATWTSEYDKEAKTWVDKFIDGRKDWGYDQCLQIVQLREEKACVDFLLGRRQWNPETQNDEAPDFKLRTHKDLQSVFALAMKKAYWSPPKFTNFRWDPVIHKWQCPSSAPPAELFPWSQSRFVDDIFGTSPTAHLFGPENGLFLECKIRRALDKGLVAIVPDIDVHGEEKEVQRRIDRWENQTVKDYKCVVTNPAGAEANKTIFWREAEGLGCLAELDGRKLVFPNDFRPRPRYIWWTYLNMVLRVAWKAQSCHDGIDLQDVQRCVRYWGGRGKYVRRHQLQGFVNTFGSVVEGLMDQAADEDETEEPGLELLAALVQGAIQESMKGDEEWEEDDGCEEEEEHDDNGYNEEEEDDEW
ncbi:hypothetical protein F53441_5402 [Fusarium austroafricanum]|uniref:HNH nuclease domain-containing protein n=1 Tax=Fusarium austroafricanum TaxID=2364996 RepID=A0A8H4KM41_9HYPO|nr:hypothetical protein F53441_5402 [Fusarium austroafricanum]